MQTFTNTTLSLSVFSGKGGVGKSSLCANLGFCLGEMGHSCLLMDCDLGLANLDVLLGVTSSATLQDQLSNGAEARNILLPLSTGVDLIPAASGVLELVGTCRDGFKTAGFPAPKTAAGPARL